MLNREIIAELYPRAAEAHAAAIASHGAALLGRFGIAATATRLHFFLAQVGHESGGLTVMQENLSYRALRICQVWPSRFPSLDSARPFERQPELLANKVYCDRMGNGPQACGDGWRYRGRGYIQITGRDGYRRVGDIAGIDLVGDPDQAVAPDQALLTACAFWQWKDLNALCDAGDFVKVTRRINGGTTGMADRRAWLDKVRRVFAAPPAPAEQPSAEQAIAVQRALQAKGFREVGAADGVVGPRTLAAIARFRQENGLPEGGIDAALLQALGLSDQAGGRSSQRAAASLPPRNPRATT